MAVRCPIGAHQIGVLLGIPTMPLEDEGLSTPQAVIDEPVGMVRIAPVQLQ
jgi:hypothetical protein